MNGFLKCVRRWRATLVGLATAGVLAGCAASPAQPSASSQCQAPEAVVLVIAVHENATPGLPAQAQCPVAKAVESGAPISVIAQDGAPYVAVSKKVFDIDPGSSTAGDELTRALNGLSSTVSTLEARTDGAAPLQGLQLASEITGGGAGALIVMVDPGFSDTAPLDTTTRSMSSADPGEVSAALSATGNLPRLLGATVMWAGLNQPAGAQQPLTQPQKETFTAIWSRLLEDAGAGVQFLPGPVPGALEPQTGGHTVRPVPPTQQQVLDPTTGETEVFDNTSALGFEPDSARFRDQDAAEVVAGQAAQWLVAHPAGQLAIVGTTATAGTAETRQQLSTARAQAVAKLVIAAGGPAQRIQVKGVGTDFPEFVPDLLNGHLDPVKAEANRSVRLSFTT